MHSGGHDGLEFASKKKGPRAWSWLLGGLGLLLVALSPLQADSLSGPAQRTAVFLDPGPRAGIRVESTSGSSTELPYAPGQLIVKYRDSVTEPVNRLLEVGRSFESATTDASDSLDKLHRRYGVRSARSVFRTELEEAFLSGAGQSAVKRFHGDKLRAVKEKFPHRTFRAPKGTDLPDLSPVYVLSLSAASDLESVAAEFQRDPHVEYAQPNYRAKTSFVPNDSYYGSTGSWGQPEDDLWGLKKIQMGAAWDITQGSGVIVAVVDSGLDKTHSEISANVWSNTDEIAGNGIDDDGNGYIDDTWGRDFAYGDNDPTDAFGHGTHVAGTIAAVGNNRKGIIGVAYQSKVMPVRGLDEDGFGYISDLATGITYAAENGADVINNSWGCNSPCPSNPVAEDAVRLAHGLGVVVVFAAGNSTDDTAKYSPQNIAESLVIAASTPEDQAAFFSNYGGGLDVAAPGGGDTNPPPAFDPFRNILSLKSAICSPDMCPPELIVGNKYVRQAGTSMAAPHAAGVAALIVSAHPDFTNEQVRQAIRRGSNDIGTPGFDPTFGYGRLNASSALAQSPLSALITRPAQAGTVFSGIGSVDVYGIAEGTNFSRWTLEYGAGSAPSAWTVIATSTTPQSGGFLATWNLSSVGDGNYTLRLTAQKANGETYEDRQPVVIDNVVLTSPMPDQITAFRGGDTITVVGTAAPFGFSRFVIRVQDSYGNWLTNPDITLTGNGLQPVHNGVLGTWNTAGLVADHYMVRLEITLGDASLITADARVIVDPTLYPGWPQNLGLFGSGGFGFTLTDHMDAVDVNGDGAADLPVGYGQEVRIFDHTGVQLPGWPQSVDPNALGAVIQKSPAAGDLTGDGRPEIVAANNSGQVFIWQGNGELLPGWPQTRSDTVASAAIEDIDGDGMNEVITADWRGEVDVFNRQGISLPGWPVMVTDAPSPANALFSVAVADVDGDGDKEIVVSNETDVYLLQADGTVRTGWPVMVNSRFDSHPALGDLDGNGDLEIIVGGSDGTVHAFHHDGTNVAGWPRTTQGVAVNSPTIGDIDGDGRPEVVAGIYYVYDGNWWNYLYAWHGDGSLLNGWPVRYDLQRDHPTQAGPVGNAFFGFGAAALADVNGDGIVDVIASSDVYNPAFALNAYNAAGMRIPGFPKPTIEIGASSSNTVAVADMDGDGLLEMVWIDLNNNLYVWDLPAAASVPMPWPMFHHDARHTGAHRQTADFQISVSPANRITSRDAPVNYTVTVSSLLGYSGAVTLTLASTYPGITSQFTPNPVSIPAHGSATSTLTVNAGPTVPSGSYTLTIQGTDGTRTRSGTAILVISDKDLTVTAVQGPASANLGSSINVDTTVLNQGTDPSGAFHLSVYLSATPNLTGWNTRLWEATDTTGLAGEASRIYSATNLAIPANTQTGNYYLVSYADDLGQVSEKNETNNLRAVPIEITAPDLIMSALSGPASALSGTVITLPNTVTNQGSGNANAFAVYFNLSSDPVITTSDIGTSIRYVGGLSPGASDSAQTEVLIPLDTPSGIYYLGAIADAQQFVVEGNEGNNSLAGNTIQITLNRPDLIVGSVTGPTSARRGETISGTVTVQNQGVAPTGAGFAVTLYLSKDNVITMTDVLLGPVSASILNAGASQTLPYSKTIPASMAKGTYYIGAIADSASVIVESNESNNATAGNTISIR